MNAPASPIRPRAAKRTRVMLVATLYSPVGAHRVRIRDISQTGTRLVCDTAVPAECDTIFKRGPAFVAARVSWSTGREAGLKFYRELNSAELETSFHGVVRR